MFWRSFSATPTDWFISAVDDLIANARHAPMVEDMAKAVDLAKNRHYSDRNSRSMTQILEDASRSTTADKELAKACLDNLRGFLGRQIDKETFLRHCDELQRLADTISPKTKWRGETHRDVYNAN